MQAFANVLSSAAVTGRLARKAAFVAWVEMPDARSVFELDADDAAHADTLARVWCEKLGAASASSRKVRANGLTRCITVHSAERLSLAADHFDGEELAA